MYHLSPRVCVYIFKCRGSVARVALCMDDTLGVQEKLTSYGMGFLIAVDCFDTRFTLARCMMDVFSEILIDGLISRMYRESMLRLGQHETSNRFPYVVPASSQPGPLLHPR